MICKRCKKDFPRRTGSYCGGCMPDDQLTGLQLAKRYKVPYVKLVIDKRHLRSETEHVGQIIVDGGALGETLEAAHHLLGLMVNGEE